MELDDIQALIVRAHKEYKAATYLMIQVSKATTARIWLGNMVNRITPASEKPSGTRFQLALTWKGLQALGFPKDHTEGFAIEFIQGMDSEHRARVLGDLNQSAAEHWDWGSRHSQEIHLMLMVFALDQPALESELGQLLEAIPGSGMKVVKRLNTQINDQEKEHFGFRDGISQPIIQGLKREGADHNTVPQGEFVLGYKNTFDEYPDSPCVPPSWDSNQVLPADVNGSDQKDWGKNGSYLVFRQLEQDVKGFWGFLEETIKKEKAKVDVRDCTQLAAKMVGRWPDGTPVVLHPDKECPGSYEDRDFLYNNKDSGNDQEGHKCPFGAHLRRAHPRDSIPDCSQQTSIRISKGHRILRRGRNFGPPLVPGFAPAEILEAKDDGKSRGLHFICFNANISRQFEFIQHTWNDNTKFAGLYDDPDPILGIKDSRNKNETHDFTIPAYPVRRKIRGLRRFVHVKGGAYFFMPGINALRFLSQFQADPS